MTTPRHLKRTAIAATLALTLAACGKSPEEHFQRARDLVQKADYKAAVIELKSVLQEQPDNREARQLLGELFVRNGAYPDAEKELSRARSLGAPDDEVLPVLAKTYVRMGDPQKALGLDVPPAGLSAGSLAALHAARAEAQLTLGQRDDAEASIGAAKQADPTQPELLLTEAKLALMDSEKAQAGRLIDDALKQDPGLADALYFKALLLESDNKSDAAARVYQQILASDPSQFRAHLALASLHLKAGDVAAADKAVRAAEKVAANVPLVLYARGTLELQRGNWDEASGALLKVLQVLPGHQASTLAYAMASYGLGNYQQSISHARKVLGGDPNNLIATRVLAGSLLKTGDVKGAIATLEPALARHPQDARLLTLAGDAYLHAGNHNKAMALLDQAAELEPGNAAIKTRRAASHLAAGDSAGALSDLEAAASQSEKAGQADLALVMVRLRDKDYERALQAISRLEEKLPNNPVTHNLRAAALLGKGDRDGARKALARALAIDPKFHAATFNLARMDVQDNRLDAARKRFEGVLAADQANVQAMLALAGLEAAAKNTKGYVKWLEKAAKANPRAIQPQAQLIQHHLARKENQKALALAREAAAANPGSPQALTLLGTTQLSTGDHAAAVATFGRLTQMAPRSPEAHLRLAMAQMADKQRATARSTLKTAIDLDPAFLPAHEAMMRLELADKRPDAALNVARQMQSRAPGSAAGFDHAADILLSQKRYPEAVKAYEQALSNGAGTPGLIKLHRALSLAGDAKAADQRLSVWLRQHPEDQAARAFAAETYMQASRTREAIAQYEMLVKANPGNAIMLNNLAALYQRENDGRAAATAERALKLAPQHPGIQDTLGWILLEQGNVPRATELLAKAAGKVPKAGNIRYHYGVALARGGRKAEARKELEAAVASGQPFPELKDAKALLKTL